MEKQMEANPKSQNPGLLAGFAMRTLPKSLTLSHPKPQTQNPKP